MSDRARPWRRSGSHAVVPPLLGGLLATYLARRPKADLERLTEAYNLAELAHRGQTRRTGEAYINHPVAVARIVANLGLDETTVVVSLIHDVVEDTTVSLGDVEKHRVSSCNGELTKYRRCGAKRVGQRKRSTR